jgi:hypothetical protein
LGLSGFIRALFGAKLTAGNPKKRPEANMDFKIAVPTHIPLSKSIRNGAKSFLTLSTTEQLYRLGSP